MIVWSFREKKKKIDLVDVDKVQSESEIGVSFPSHSVHSGVSGLTDKLGTYWMEVKINLLP